MGRWWKKQGVTMRVGIITASVLVIVGCFTSFVSLIGSNLAFLINVPAETQKKRLPPSEITSFDFSEPGRLIANHDGTAYFLITPKCWKVQNGKGDITIEGVEYPTVKMNFSVIARKEQILIDDISIKLEQYSDPPDTTQVSDYSIKLGQYGGGGIQFIDLGEVDIFPNYEEFHPSDNKSFKIPAMDALGFEITTSFRQPGSYSVRIELLARDFWRREQKLTSDILNFSWIATPDLRNISFRDPISGNDTQLELCQ